MKECLQGLLRQVIFLSDIDPLDGPLECVLLNPDALNGSLVHIVGIPLRLGSHYEAVLSDVLDGEVVRGALVLETLDVKVLPQLKVALHDQ